MSKIFNQFCLYTLFAIDARTFLNFQRGSNTGLKSAVMYDGIIGRIEFLFFFFFDSRYVIIRKCINFPVFFFSIFITSILILITIRIFSVSNSPLILIQTNGIKRILASPSPTRQFSTKIYNNTSSYIIIFIRVTRSTLAGLI